MRRIGLALAVGACGPLVWRCGGASGQPDASGPDATVDVTADVIDAAVDVVIDAPPERAIWVASETTLFKFDPFTHVIVRVADFDCSGEPMVDLAMDGNEQLYGITSESVVHIDKTTGVCAAIARGAQDLPYATAFVPAASLEAGVEGWFGYKYSAYSAIAPDSGNLTFVGILGPKSRGLEATGDLVTVPGGPTYLTSTSLDPTAQDVLMEVDPNTGATTQTDIATGAGGLVGMAQWGGTLFIFAEDGRVFRVVIGDAGQVIEPYGVTIDWGDAGATDAGADADASSAPLPPSWRGAAVTTRAPGI